MNQYILFVFDIPYRNVWSQQSTIFCLLSCRWCDYVWTCDLWHYAVHLKSHLNLVCGSGRQYGQSASGRRNRRHEAFPAQCPNHGAPALRRSKGKNRGQKKRKRGSSCHNFNTNICNFRGKQQILPSRLRRFSNLKDRSTTSIANTQGSLWRL